MKDEMIDIMERLRLMPPLCAEAAEEIERLREALREIADSGDFSTGSDWGDLVLSRDIARKALTTRLSGKE
jgi:hypothetical protein